MPATAEITREDSGQDFLIDLGLAKASPEDIGDPWILYIHASTPIRDFQGESLLTSAVRKALPYFLANGKIAYEHVTKETRHDPSILIGEPQEARFDDDGLFYVKALLYRFAEKAKEVRNILLSGGRLKASLGGTILEKDPASNIVTKIFLNHIAVTSWPVNDYTGVQLTPYDVFLKSLGVAEAAPLIHEDLEGDGKMQDIHPAFAKEWKTLTDLVMHNARCGGRAVTLEKARRHALMLLVKHGAGRHIIS